MRASWRKGAASSGERRRGRRYGDPLTFGASLGLPLRVGYWHGGGERLGIGVGGAAATTDAGPASMTCPW